jgi:Ca-activated chloride channel family protein
VLLIVALWKHEAGNRKFEALCDASLLPHLILDGAQTGGSSWKLSCLLVCWLVTVTALAGPVWEKQPQPVFHLKTGRVILLDLSPSMAAQDVKPSRLKRAMFKIRDILRKNREGLTGLVVFSGEAFTVVPLTEDTATVEAMLPALSTGIMPVTGDRASEALSIAGDLLNQAGITAGTVIMITDGISDMASALHEISRLRSEGITVSVLGVGTERGAPVPAPGGGFMNNAQGSPRIAGVDQARLEELARAGGGVYSPLRADESDINRLLPQNRNSALSESREEKKSRVDRWQEQGAWLVLLLIPAALAAFRRGWLLVLFIVWVPGLSSQAHAFTWQDLWQRQDQQAWDLYQKGEYDRAAKLFREPERRAAALYKAGKYSEAAEVLKEGQGESAAYNRGNSLARSGRLEEALKAYDEALKLDPGDEDAKFNRDLVRKLLEQKKNNEQNHKNQKGNEGRNGEDENSGRQKGENDPGGDQNRQDRDRSSQKKSGQSQGRNGQDGKSQGNQGRDQEQPQHERASQAKSGGREEHKEKETPEQHQGEQSAGMKPDGQPENRGRTPGAARAGEADESGAKSEKEMALEQWLKQIPDDPSGLLRRKFYMEHQRRLHGQ